MEEVRQCDICLTNMGNIVRVCPCRWAHWSCQLRWAEMQTPDIHGNLRCEICRTVYAKYEFHNTWLQWFMVMAYGVCVTLQVTSLLVFGFFVITASSEAFLDPIGVLFLITTRHASYVIGNCTERLSRWLWGSDFENVGPMSYILFNIPLVLDVIMVILMAAFLIYQIEISLTYFFVLVNSVIMMAQSIYDFGPRVRIRALRVAIVPTFENVDTSDINAFGV